MSKLFLIFGLSVLYVVSTIRLGQIANHELDHLRTAYTSVLTATPEQIDHVTTSSSVVLQP